MAATACWANRLVVMASTRLGRRQERGRPAAAAHPPTTVASTAPAPQSAATFGRPRPTSVAIRTPRTDAGRSSSTATVPCAMSVPMSSMWRALTETIAASDVTMYQVSATAV